LVGCEMKLVKPGELGLSGIKKVVVVDPESHVREVVSIGHGRRSHTFLPQIVPDPEHTHRAYCDCPGFADNRGAEINIANAINTRRVLQRARGVKAVFLAEYAGLIGNRGSSIRALESMCHQLFGNADNLRRHQHAVLLGITKAPLYEDDEPVTRSMMHSLLTRTNTPTMQILADRIFLYDPLDRGRDNPDFWSVERCRDEIDQLDSIPQREATTLFQTVLTDSDRTHLLNTIRQLRPKISHAITQGDEVALGQHWQLLQRLQVVQYPEIDQLIEEEVLPAINVALKQLGDLETWTDEDEFDQAEAHIEQLTRLIQQLPGAMLDVDLNALNQRLTHYREQYAQRQRMNTEKQRLEHELIQLNEQQQLSTTRDQNDNPT